MATSIIKPVHAGIDFSFTIAVADWSSSSPYTYTWTNSAVTDGCRVEVDFSSASTNTDIMYLSYEKVNGGIQFTAPAKPTMAIVVVVHVINAQTGNTLAVTDEMVSSDAISGAANVNEALTTLNSNTATKASLAPENGAYRGWAYYNGNFWTVFCPLSEYVVKNYNITVGTVSKNGSALTKAGGPTKNKNGIYQQVSNGLSSDYNQGFTMDLTFTAKS